MVKRIYRPLKENMPTGRKARRKEPIPYYSRKRRRRGKSFKVIFWALLTLFLLVAVALSYLYYIVKVEAATTNKETSYVYITDATTEDGVFKQLTARSGLRHPRVFSRYASRKKLEDNLHNGRYGITFGMTMDDIIKKLNSGEQTPVELRIGLVRTMADLEALFTKSLLLPVDSLRGQLTDTVRLRQLGDFTQENVRGLFIPGDYELLWDISAASLIDTMQLRYDAFWTDSRREKAKSLGLTQQEVITLASIVQSESSKIDEHGQIARLYLNRLAANMSLQADPTVIYALQQFDIKRVTREHLRVDSPYNTYRSRGLPPGPIVLPRTATVDSVLAAPSNGYLYMCAREDFSGYHNFAKTYAEHQKNARRYQAELDKRNIK